MPTKLAAAAVGGALIAGFLMAAPTAHSAPDFKPRPGMAYVGKGPGSKQCLKILSIRGKKMRYEMRFLRGRSNERSTGFVSRRSDRRWVGKKYEYSRDQFVFSRGKVRISSEPETWYLYRTTRSGYRAQCL